MAATKTDAVRPQSLNDIANTTSINQEGANEVGAPIDVQVFTYQEKSSSSEDSEVDDSQEEQKDHKAEIQNNLSKILPKVSNKNLLKLRRIASSLSRLCAQGHKVRYIRPLLRSTPCR